jgi:hypothetical protein
LPGFTFGGNLDSRPIGKFVADSGNYGTNSICFKGSHEMTVAKLLLASVLMTVVATTTARADPNQHLCTVEHAAGLRYDKQTGAWHAQEDKAAVMSEMFYCKPNLADAVFDGDTRRFEIVYHGAYVVQGFWEQRRRESPTAKLAADPSKPDDLFIEIGNCSPS